MQKIGVIVPVYKVEKYIAECIESILAQTYTNFRLILVDDGSPDNAGKICDEYAKKDQRITVIHQENAGVTRARARGVEEAKDCEWISFVDGDDTISRDALKCLLSHTNQSVDIVLAKMSRDSEKVKESRNKYKTKQIRAEQHRISMILGIDSGPTAKLFRKNLFTDNVFDIPQSVTMGEDTIANIRIAFNNKKDVVTTTQCIYYYRQHESSIMHTFSKSSEYENLFIEQVVRSIQDYDRYVKYVIIRKIKTFDNNFGYSTEIPKWRGTIFYHTLLREIREYNIKQLFIERLLITATNRNTRKILIFIKRVKNKLFGQDCII